MQNVKFRSVDEFLHFLPENESKIVNLLRQIILDTLPNCTEKLSYNVPFYKVNKNICFVWPSAVTWGNVKKDGVRLGFTNGHLLTNENNYLVSENRKRVYCKDFFDVKEVEVDLIKQYLFEALLIDNLANGKR